MDERRLPRPIDEIIQPFQRFAALQASGGIALLGCTFAALAWANSPWAETYEAFWQTRLALHLGNWHLERPLHQWINEGLMTLFFFIAGLEIKRELLVGELSSPRHATLPLLAAMGGMALPAALYLAFNAGTVTQNGWGMAVATDIAFSLGILTLLGERVPSALMIFVTAFAIIDDIGAILIIALFYSTQILWVPLAVAGAFVAALVGANLLRVRSPFVYGMLGFGLWLALLHSGIHATLAGVIAAMTIPGRTLIRGREFLRRGRHYLGEFEKTEHSKPEILENERRLNAVQALERACEQVETPLQRLAHSIQPWVTYCIMPLFALANAGIPIHAEAWRLFTRPMGIGILVGLVVGKPLGILAGSWLSVWFRVGRLPEKIGWSQLWGVGCLGGIGFTMSLFIAEMAFRPGALLQEAKLAILSASCLSALIGLSFLRSLSRRS